MTNKEEIKLRIVGNSPLTTRVVDQHGRQLYVNQIEWRLEAGELPKVILTVDDIEIKVDPWSKEHDKNQKAD